MRVLKYSTLHSAFPAFILAFWKLVFLCLAAGYRPSRSSGDHANITKVDGRGFRLWHWFNATLKCGFARWRRHFSRSALSLSCALPSARFSASQ